MEQTYPAIQDIPEDPEVHDGTVMVPEPVEYVLHHARYGSQLTGGNEPDRK